MINRTMMHHPMHLHGHFFRVLNGQGEHVPLKHTVDVAPMSDTRNILAAKWEVGWQEVDDTDWETILTWDRYFNRFFTLFAGVDVLGEGDETDETRGVLGFHYLLPLNFESRTWVDTEGGVRVNLEKEFQLTPRLALIGEVEYDSHDLWEGKVGLNYTLSKNVSIVGQWHADFSWGGGIQVRF